MNSIAARKHRELRNKLDGLAADFKRWRGEANETFPLRLHQSQIHAILGATDAANVNNKAPLAALWRNIDQRIGKDAPTEAEARAFLDRTPATESLLAGAHSIWGFFREKFAQRYTPDSSKFLAIADEVAWACYQPAMKAAGKKNSPPLTHLIAIETLGTGEILEGAAILPRGGDWLPSQTGTVFAKQEKLRNLLRPLAVPIMAIPWGQVAHLPELPIIAHETGHAVEDDFGLTKELKELMRSAIQASGVAGKSVTNDAAWQRWLGELFADFHAIAHVGPAFVAALTDLLAGSDHRGRAEDLSMGNYPTDSLRLRIGRAALAALNFKTEAQTLAQTWKQAVPTDPPAPEFDGVAIHVAEAFLKTELAGLGGASLEQLGNWTAERRRQLDPDELPANSTDTRLLVAMTRRSYDETPEAFFPNLDQRWRARLMRCLPQKGTRGAADVVPPDVDLAKLILGN